MDNKTRFSLTFNRVTSKFQQYKNLSHRIDISYLCLADFHHQNQKFAFILDNESWVYEYLFQKLVWKVTSKIQQSSEYFAHISRYVVNWGLRNIVSKFEILITIWKKVILNKENLCKIAGNLNFPTCFKNLKTEADVVTSGKQHIRIWTFSSDKVGNYGDFLKNWMFLEK